ncbi:hypothetical protein GCM10011607_12840 [Shewanella inventionis]|uniref:Uncharacterized protein n=1 Tax=Shewanella inventionis TaxID=1738770 RepID=A0ABQ1IXM5_9GAMM|nr:hypothetical protein [Shewanella inventionis]GGB53694.1 hypothetical protein GCM10011607_12840 [Shewanella inventionis]
MTPLCAHESEQINKGNYALKYSVHKYNAYISGRTITLSEAARCVVYQTKWAASHEQVELKNNCKLNIDVTILSETDVEGMGKYVVVLVKYSDKEHQCHFIVTESPSHWFFLNYGLLSIIKPFDVDKVNPTTTSIARYS